MRIVVISDVHSNLVALDAVLAAAGSVDATWHLGDIVGYGPEPDGVVARLRERDAVGVRGNHDGAATGTVDLDWFNADARRAMEWTQRTISAETRAWLAAQPQTLEAADLTLVHGSPNDPTWEYVMSATTARASLDAVTTRHGLHGHTHLPVAWLETDGRVGAVEPGPGDRVGLGDGRLFLNPGSVGQPRDGDPRASFLILDLDEGSATWDRVAYDIDAVARAMRSAGLPARLAERLYHGL